MGILYVYYLRVIYTLWIILGTKIIGMTKIMTKRLTKVGGEA